MNDNIIDDTNITDDECVLGDALNQPTNDDVMPLSQFIKDFGGTLMDAVKTQLRPTYLVHDESEKRLAVMDGLKRKPFVQQQDVVQAVTKLMIDEGAPASVINAEMGTGKTMMAICAAAVMHAEGYQRTLVVSPPHLVYKWRREILETVPNARVWVLNGPDTLRKLLLIRNMLNKPDVPEFFVMGRVRMRMGFDWRPAFAVRRYRQYGEMGEAVNTQVAACPKCGTHIQHSDEEPIPLTPQGAQLRLNEKRQNCRCCGERLWTLSRRKGEVAKTRQEIVMDALVQIPTIGKKTAERLYDTFGDGLGKMLEDNVYSFINLMDENGELVFTDNQARRMERAMSRMEFSFGQGGYQPTEFIKRYLPSGYFGLLVVDEGHEYKNEGSAQGQAMAVLARKCKKTLLLTGTLMGGYADDLFYLLWRLNPQLMIDDGFTYRKGGLGSAAQSFLRQHGVIKEVTRVKSSDSERRSHRTAKGDQIDTRSAKAPGFGPKGIMRYVVPYTAFLKLKDIGGNILPAYQEHFEKVEMTAMQGEMYSKMASSLQSELRQALAKGDTSLMSVVLNTLLAWPDTCFRSETVLHPHSRATLAYAPSIFDETEISPKEARMLEICKAEKLRGRRTLVYTVYTGTRDTTGRLKSLLEDEGLRVAVLKASVEAAKREDWLLDQVDRGVDVIITNPELVKTGLDMLQFPTIVFMQTGYNVYTVQQAARRSWRIGQKLPVDVYFLGYGDSAQITCLELMAKKITVSQSTSGDMPDSGLDILNQSGDSVEVALAKQLLGRG